MSKITKFFILLSVLSIIGLFIAALVVHSQISKVELLQEKNRLKSRRNVLFYVMIIPFVILIFAVMSTKKEGEGEDRLGDEYISRTSESRIVSPLISSSPNLHQSTAKTPTQKINTYYTSQDDCLKSKLKLDKINRKKLNKVQIYAPPEGYNYYKITSNFKEMKQLLGEELTQTITPKKISCEVETIIHTGYQEDGILIPLFTKIDEVDNFLYIPKQQAYGKESVSEDELNKIEKGNTDQLKQQIKNIFESTDKPKFESQ